MPFVRVSDGQLYYHRVGTGPPLVLVNEWPLSHSYWGPLADRLKSRWSVIGFDPRGIGRSRSFSSDAPYDVEAHAEDLHELISGLGLGEAHIVAHALGAISAALCLHAHPQDVRTLTILNPIVLPHRPQITGRYLASAQLLLMLRPLAAVPLLHRLLLRRYALGRVPSSFRRLLQDDLLQMDARAAWEWIHSATDEPILQRFVHAMCTARCPILLVACKRDVEASVQAARWLFERIPAGMLVTMASPAHFPMVEAPDRVSQTLDEFYRKSTSC